MSSISGRELAKAVERHGWTFARVHGSHHIYVREGSAVRLSIPVHANRALKRGLLLHLLKQAGLSEQDV